MSRGEVILALCIGAIMALCFMMILATVPAYPRNNDRGVDPAVKSRMRYHGVQMSYEKHDGVIYFERDGKEIRL